MKLSKDEIKILEWAGAEGCCAVVWPISANDELYLAGKRLEKIGLLKNIDHSPQQWIITEFGREALVQQAELEYFEKNAEYFAWAHRFIARMCRGAP